MQAIVRWLTPSSALLTRVARIARIVLWVDILLALLALGLSLTPEAIASAASSAASEQAAVNLLLVVYGSQVFAFFLSAFV